MASSPIAAPGSEYGPCVDENCGHEGCRCNREATACLCRLCGEPIGYDRHCYDEWYDQPNGSPRYAFFVHATCLEMDIEAKRRA